MFRSSGSRPRCPVFSSSLEVPTYLEKHGMRNASHWPDLLRVVRFRRLFKLFPPVQYDVKSRGPLWDWCHEHLLFEVSSKSFRSILILQPRNRVLQLSTRPLSMHLGDTDWS